MNQFQAQLDWIDGQKSVMIELLTRWVSINSHSFNLSGLQTFAKELKACFGCFEEKVSLLDIPPMTFVNSKGIIEERTLGKALKLQMRPNAPVQVLLMIHMDTVYPQEQAFHLVNRNDEQRMQGPGAADAKGGIAVMLKALEAFEQFSGKDRVGWTVFINPDEEVGSAGSREIFHDLVKNKHVGLIFEPCLPNGHLVGDRKGSGNFTLVIRGRAAHAGRDPHLGRNAVDVLAGAITKINAIHGKRPGLIVNIGMVEGGSAVNVVPEIAITRFNIRIDKPEDESHVWVELKQIEEEIAKLDGIEAALHGGFFAPPKILNGEILDLYKSVQACAAQLDLALEWQPSGGVCDGNRLAAFGLPNVDTLGVRGGNIHSDQEFVQLDSLTERAKLTALYLMSLAEKGK